MEKTIEITYDFNALIDAILLLNYILEVINEELEQNISEKTRKKLNHYKDTALKHLKATAILLGSECIPKEKKQKN